MAKISDSIRIAILIRIDYDIKNKSLVKIKGGFTPPFIALDDSPSWLEMI